MNVYKRRPSALRPSGRNSSRYNLIGSGVCRTRVGSTSVALVLPRRSAISPRGLIYEIRAWCLQERFIAPRILHFGVDELHWECSSEACCQCVDLGYRMTNEKMWQKRLFHMDVQRATKRATGSAFQISIVTKWTDRLPALSKLAKQFMASEVTAVSSQPGQALKFNQPSLGGYLAGPWSTTIEKGLC